jgi:hypothetical protein
MRRFGPRLPQIMGPLSIGRIDLWQILPGRV